MLEHLANKYENIVNLQGRRHTVAASGTACYDDDFIINIIIKDVSTASSWTKQRHAAIGTLSPVGALSLGVLLFGNALFTERM